MTNDPDAKFLVSYDYGMGGVWAIIVAPTAEAILDAYPEVQIVNDRPDWMDADQYERLPTLRVDQPPTGLLAWILENRNG
jgi:hypothetical protein